FRLLESVRAPVGLHHSSRNRAPCLIIKQRDSIGETQEVCRFIRSGRQLRRRGLAMTLRAMDVSLLVQLQSDTCGVSIRYGEFHLEGIPSIDGGGSSRDVIEIGVDLGTQAFAKTLFPDRDKTIRSWSRHWHVF